MFDVAVWGDVATWAGSIGTSAAALIAAITYAFDKRASARMQSRQVILQDNTRECVLTIMNKSSMPIFHVFVAWNIDVYRRPKDAPIDYEYRLRHEMQDNRGSWDVIDAGKSETLKYDATKLPSGAYATTKPFLYMQDSRGQGWIIPRFAEHDAKPKKYTPSVNEQVGLFETLGLVRPILGSLIAHSVLSFWRKYLYHPKGRFRPPNKTD